MEKSDIIMTSTELSMGLSNSRPSSRVLKPPGGGHTNLFGGPEVKVNPPRPKYNQQNSSNLNECMNTTDPNITLKQLREEVEKKPAPVAAAPQTTEKVSPSNGTSEPLVTPQPRGRVPPGGFSSGGFW